MYSTALAETVRTQARDSFRGPFVFIFGLVQPVTLSTVVLRAAEHGDRNISPSDVLVGVWLISVWSSTVWSSGRLLNVERAFGTLPRLFAGRTDAQLVLLVKSLTVITVQAGVITLSLAGVAVVERVPFAVADPVVFVPGLVLTLASAATLGLALANLYILTRSAARISEALLYPVFILGGLLVPTSYLPGILPDIVEPLSWLVSLRGCGEILRTAVVGDPTPGRAWAAVVGITILYATGARLGFHHVQRRARIQGSLDVV